MSPSSTRTPCRALGVFQVLGHDRLVRRQPVHVAQGCYVQQNSPGHDPVAGRLDGMGLSPFPRGNQVGRLAVVQLPLPGVVGQGVDVGDGLAVEDHSDIFGGSPSGQRALRGIGVPALPAVHHVALHLKGCVGRHFRQNRPGAAYRDPVLHQTGGLLGLGRRNQVEAAPLVIVAPSSPIAQRAHPTQHLLFRRILVRHEC